MILYTEEKLPTKMLQGFPEAFLNQNYDAIKVTVMCNFKNMLYRLEECVNGKQDPHSIPNTTKTQRKMRERI